MRIAELYARSRPVISFEFFPPRTEAGYAPLYRTIADLKRLDPGFVSVTWGAGGSTRTKTIDLVVRIPRELGITATAHLTCGGATREQLADSRARTRDEGLENVLALRGDPPRDQPEFRPVPGGFAYANELAAFVRQRFDLCIGGACHPE